MATKFDLAISQFIGFKHGKWNRDDCLGLVMAMGLTKTEWLKLKEQEVETYLDKDEIKEIDEYFGYAQSDTIPLSNSVGGVVFLVPPARGKSYF